MFVPTFDDDISVLVNHSLDLAEIVRFDALLLCENKLRAIPLELGHDTIALHMDVQWLMFLAVEENENPKNLNTSGIFPSFYCLSATKIGIIFDTKCVFANYLP